MISYHQHAKDYPPCLVRLLARKKGGPPLTTAEITTRSGLSEYTVLSIGWSLSWDLIPFGWMTAFLDACGMNFDDPVAMNRKKCYLRTPNKFKYLRRSAEWDTVLKPLVARYREYLKPVIR